MAVADPLLGLRWELAVEGAERLPTVGGAVLVFNRRLGASEPWVLARGIRRSTGRFVRTIGVPDVAPIGPFLRRFGGVLDRPDEIAGLLRAGQLVGVPMARDLRSRERVGALDAERLEAAIATDRPVVPVALVGREIGRSWRIVVGEPVPYDAEGGPLAAAEPKTLRWRLWHTPARVIRKARRHVIRLLDGWPDTTEILAAYQRIAALA